MSIDMTLGDVSSANSGGSWGGGSGGGSTSSDYNSVDWPYDAAGHPMGTSGYSGMPDRDYSAKSVAEAHAEVSKVAIEAIKAPERSKTPAPITPERAATPHPAEESHGILAAVESFVAHHLHLHIHLPNPNPVPPTPYVPPPVLPNTPAPVTPAPGKREPW